MLSITPLRSINIVANGRISSFFIVGFYNVYGTILYSIFGLYGLTPVQSSNIYFISTGIGVFASLVMSIWIDKTKKFKQFLTTLAGGGIIIQGLFSIICEISLRNQAVFQNLYIISLILYSLVNIVGIPFWTIGMEYACEITYPVGESLSGGILLTFAQTNGL